MSRLLRITSPAGVSAHPGNLEVTVDGERLDGVVAIEISPVDARIHDLCKAVVTAEVEFDLNIMVAHDPQKTVLVAELAKLRDTLCPSGCAAGHVPIDTCYEGLQHAFGPCPAEPIVRRLAELTNSRIT